jgi:hypothetical protein
VQTVVFKSDNAIEVAVILPEIRRDHYVRLHCSLSQTNGALAEADEVLEWRRKDFIVTAKLAETSPKFAQDLPITAFFEATLWWTSLLENDPHQITTEASEHVEAPSGSKWTNPRVPQP